MGAIAQRQGRRYNSPNDPFLEGATMDLPAGSGNRRRLPRLIRGESRSRLSRAEPSDRGWAERLVAHLRRDVPLALIDLCGVFAAYFVAFVLRFQFEGGIPDAYLRNFWAFLPFVAVIHIVSNTLFGLYGQMWRYASVLEARRVLLAGLAGGTVVVGVDVLVGRAGGTGVVGVDLFVGDGRPLPVLVVVLGATLSLLAFGAIRFQSRLFAFRRRSASREAKRVLLVGAGDAGAMVLKDILHN